MGVTPMHLFHSRQANFFVIIIIVAKWLTLDVTKTKAKPVQSDRS